MRVCVNDRIVGAGHVVGVLADIASSKHRNRTQKVAGVRHWRSGDQAVLFLRPSQESDGTLEVTGLMQGNFIVHKNATGETMVSNGVPDVSAYQASSNAVTQYRGSGMRLDELESRVRKATKQ